MPQFPLSFAVVLYTSRNDFFFKCQQLKMFRELSNEKSRFESRFSRWKISERRWWEAQCAIVMEDVDKTRRNLLNKEGKQKSLIKTASSHDCIESLRVNRRYQVKSPQMKIPNWVFVFTVIQSKQLRSSVFPSEEFKRKKKCSKCLSPLMIEILTEQKKPAFVAPFQR